MRWSEAARAIGAVVVSDECYAELAWDEPLGRPSGVPSVLDPRVCGGSHEGLLAAYSLSKQSNIAGYRAAFLAGDAALIADLTQTRKHLGLIVPAPVQAAMTAALSDDEHVAAQREVYGARRRALAPAIAAAGFLVEESGSRPVPLGGRAGRTLRPAGSRMVRGARHPDCAGAPVRRRQAHAGGADLY